MYLDHLRLSHFRNYEELTVDFAPGLNILLGKNAQGKTNLLEAIYVLALARSHRTHNDHELIQWGAEAATVTGRVVKQSGRTPLQLTITKKGKKASVNHLEQSRLSSYLGQLNVVLFAPEDLNLVKGAPSQRRRFVDMEFGQMSPKYLYNLTQYRAILRQRNKYLRQLHYHEAKDLVYLDVLSDQLAGFGAEIIHTRQDLLNQMMVFANQLHQEITQGKETLTFQYVVPSELSGLQSAQELYQALLTLYQKLRTREIEQSVTLAGPHRDDVLFMTNDKNVAAFGSQGQQRTAALSVKLAEIELMKQQTGEYPLLLLDDVLSELDTVRQTHLLATFQSKVQTFLTTTDLSGVAKDIVHDPRIMTIDEGHLTVSAPGQMPDAEQ
ncbi:MAG: DNA replication/repair protein RecF [Schleiferilactobacillus harbinensis]|jgi:DNA replication and repair protein RecF|nr:DNA replication/repair protein RecF [Schleiferilactobacillus harbinensis]MCI1912674.1 DNA replication/repair protein RecF [Schleiferilactobacillus harbinensis]